MINAQTRQNAQEVYDYILMNPSKHDQGNWGADERGNIDATVDPNACGTTMCIAGTAVWLHEGTDSFRTLMADRDDDDYTIWSQQWVTHGSILLGLTERQADMLFYQMDEEVARNMLGAVAQGDAEKFDAIYRTAEDLFDE